jgi:hypothetical protein
MDLSTLPAIPDYIKNIMMYGVSGFSIGFLNAFIATQGQTIDLQAALLAACVAGTYQAAKEILKALTPAPQLTAAKNVAAAPNPHPIDRMV